MRRASCSLLAALVLAPGLAAAPIEPGADDPKAVAALRQMNVVLVLDEAAPGRPVVAVTFPFTLKRVDAALALLKKLPNLPKRDAPRTSH
jgi:hypothetical protein